MLKTLPFQLFIWLYVHPATVELPAKRKTVPVTPFIADSELAVVVKKPRGPRIPRKEPAKVVVSDVMVAQGKRKCAGKRKVVDSSSDSDDSVDTPTAVARPVREKATTLHQSDSFEVQKEKEKVALLESELLALQQEREKVKLADPEPDIVQFPTGPPQIQQSNRLTLSLPDAQGSMYVPHYGNMSELAKKLYLDSIDLKAQIDIHEYEAREQFRARKLAEAKLAQAEALAVFAGLLQR